MPSVLLIDDDVDVVEILTQVLERAGFAVRSTGDGEQALKMVEKERPDAVVTDVMIPRMDGWRICQRIKGNPLTAAIPILIMTAKTESIAELMSYESGADAYISKPFDNQEFIETVRKLTARAAG